MNLFLLMSAGALGAQAPAPKSPGPDRKGKPVSISAGQIPVQDFLRFLSDYTGLPVLHNSNDPLLESREIRLTSDIKNANADLVKQLLEINGIRVYRETLPAGDEVMKVESMSTGPVIEDPRPTAVVRVAPDGSVQLLDDRVRRAPPPAKEPSIEERLSDLEDKVKRILDALQLGPPQANTDAIDAERLSSRQRERVEALHRKFEERLAALRKEHQEALRKLTQELTKEDEMDAEDDPPSSSNSPSRPKKP